MGLLNNFLKDKIEEVRFKIDRAAKRSGRRFEDIRLIGVTKNVDSKTVIEALKLGITDFGENRVQELIKKAEEVPGANWHLIGRLQTNKVKYILEKVCLIHSIDRLELAEEINRLAKKLDITTNVLVQVNISGEKTKAGIMPESCEDFLLALSKHENIKVRGLMTIAPLTDNKEESRQIFARLYKLFIDMTRKKIHNINMEYLSAGMTNDFDVAIEEGANMVRIGTGLFGSRYIV